jgi:dienelactone hydrolase
MFRVLIALGAWLVVGAVAEAAVQTKEITYKAGKVTAKGFLAWDDAVKGPRPGVLVVHEWWGLNDYARHRAEELARLGYIALAADMYGDGQSTTHPDEAGKMASQVRANLAEWRQRAEAALDTLKAQPQCDKTRLAAIGYCFGGSTALQLAFSGADLRAVATFHAALPTPTPEDVRHTKATLLICHGADDKFISDASIKAFRDALDKGGVKYEFVSYPGAVHSFTVPEADKVGNPGMKYNKGADEDSWKRMKALFAEKFGK